MKKISLAVVVVFAVAVGVAVLRAANPLPPAGSAGSGSSVVPYAPGDSADIAPSGTYYPTELEALNSAFKGKIVDTNAEEFVGQGGALSGIEWYPQKSEASSYGVSQWTDPKVLTTILLTATSTESEDAYVLFQTSASNAHISQAELGGAILAAKGKSWSLKSVQKNIDAFGSFGNLPLPSVIMLGKDSIGFRFDNSDGGQGSFSGPLYLYSFVGGELKKVLNVGDAYADNSGAGYDGMRKTYHYDTKLEFVPGLNSRFDDIIATTDGTRAADISDYATVPIHRVVRYSFDGIEYRAVSPRIISAGPYSFIVATTSVEVLWNGQFNEKIALDPQAAGYEAVEAGIIPEDKLLITDMDVNFDGNPDLGILTGVGYGGVNYFYDFYLFDPKESGDFSKIPALKEIGNPSLDAANKQVVSTYRSGPQWYVRKFQMNSSGYSDLGQNTQIEAQ